MTQNDHWHSPSYSQTKSGAKMTSDDMQGFWELILLQVNDVNKMFEECRVMEKSNWQPPKSPVS